MSEIKTITNEEYHTGAGISNSGLGLVLESVSSYKWARSIPSKASKELDIGTATHSLVLEGEDALYQEFDVMPKIDKRTKEGKATLAAFMSTSEGKKILSDEEHLLVKEMNRSVQVHPTSKSLFTNGVAEESIFWTDEATGELCKIRPDWLKADENVIVDLKTTADINQIGKSILNFGYRRQAAFYKMGFEAHFGRELERFIFVFVSKTKVLGRYPVRVVELKDEDMLKGEMEAKTALMRYHSAVMEDNWIDVESIELPKWGN
tara:strand:- start:2162 stop:2950 length:789 start_codon:yes stop_codon:yes gene_type:complete